MKKYNFLPNSTLLFIALAPCTLYGNPYAKLSQSAARAGLVCIGSYCLYDHFITGNRKIQEKIERLHDTLKKALHIEHDETRSLIKKEHQELKTELKKLQKKYDHLIALHIKLHRNVPLRVSRNRTLDNDNDNDEETASGCQVYTIFPEEYGY